MPVESAADRAAFTNPNDFGVEATYQPQAGGTVTVSGIFDTDYLAVDLSGEVNASGVAPRFVCSTSDLPSPPAFGDGMSINGKAYKVRVIKPDGTGMTELYLEEQ